MRIQITEAALARDELLLEGLVNAGRVFRHRLRPELEREGLSSPMFWALHQVVLEGPLSVGQIAGACAVTPANVSSAIERLERAGLIVRHSAAPDRRVVHIRPTPKGRSLHHTLVLRAAKVMGESLNGVTESDLRAAVRVLSRLGGALPRVTVAAEVPR